MHSHKHQIYIFFFVCLFIYLFCYVERWTTIKRKKNNFLAYHYLYQRKQKIENWIYNLCNGHTLAHSHTMWFKFKRKCEKLYTFFPIRYSRFRISLDSYCRLSTKTCKTTFQSMLFLFVQNWQNPQSQSLTQCESEKLCSAHNTNRSRMNERMRDSWS